ncbi:MAG: outer membrane beta-barrel protein [Mucilaginibacter sp.]|nr:outer membrane beta-barrel protein [Mucilaginibacter sp.]
MKLRSFFVALLFCSTYTFSQTKNNISLIYGFNTNSVDIHGAKGDYGYNDKNGKSFGVKYTRSFTKVFSLETGLLYSTNKVQSNTIGSYGERTYNGEVHMLSVPVLAKWTFLKYLYGQSGVVFDHQTNYSAYHIVDDQSGVGIEIGIGGKYNFGPVSIFANPYITNHRFYGRNNLMEAGIKFGLGYDF